jgi:molybdopterin-guanine dinucleotide biosynthesis protein A
MTDVPQGVSLAIQAGGGSTRMGEDKALKPFLGRPLIQRVIARLSPLADEVLVTTNQPENYAFLGLRLVPDLLPGRGALGGLYTALASASFPLAAVVACDMPFASAPLLRAMIAIMQAEQVDVVIPRTATGLEPLHAVYRCAACLPAVRRALEAGQRKVIAWFPEVRVRAVTPPETAALDPSALAFWNINTPQEFLEAERLAGQD